MSPATAAATTDATPTPTAELRHVLENAKVSDMELPSKEVVEVTVDMTPVEAAKQLWSHDVRGAPVWDEKRQKYVGFFDMRDLLSTVVASHKEGQDKTGLAQEDVSWWSSKQSKPSSFSVTYLSARNAFVSLTQDATLKDVCDTLIAKQCHRVPIVDANTQRCIRILSQSALVAFLAQHAAQTDQLKHKMEETLDAAGFPYRKDVVTATDTTQAYEVFELMDSHRLSGIAIVDAEDGAIVGNTSASDIKMAVAVEEGSLADLNLTIMSYLAAVRQEEHLKEAKYPSSHVKTTSTVGHVIRLLAKTGYHRVFVVDSELKPVGVISVTDIVKFVMKHHSS